MPVPLVLPPEPLRVPAQHAAPAMLGGRNAARAAALVLAVLATACDSSTAPRPGVDLDALFAPATAAEVAAVRAQWAAPRPHATDVRVDSTGTVPWAGGSGRVRVLSHGVGAARHVGAVVVPAALEDVPAGSVPVVLYAHGGHGGVSVEELQLIAVALGDEAAGWIVVAPSFRAEELRWGPSTWTSTGDASPWDRDVEDAMALLDAALLEVPQADAGRVAALGISRGGGVAMLMAARDPRIRGVVEFFGPTDFFGPYVRGVVADALTGEVRPLPGLDVLFDAYIEPLRDGVLSMEAVRLELVRRSAVLHADLLPPLQLHHGTDDEVVHVSQAEAMIAAMAALGAQAPPFESWLYPGGDHHPTTLHGSVARSLAFLTALLE